MYLIKYFLLVFVFVSCISNTNSGNNVQADNNSTDTFLTNFNILPSKRIIKNSTNTIIVNYNKVNTPDSVILLYNNQKIKVLHNSDSIYNWKSNNLTMGNNVLSAQAFKDGNIQETKNINIFIISDIEPVKYTYKVVNTYNHDKQSYTQGLIYENGKFYESAGQYGQSSVRIVNAKTGDVEKLTDLNQSIFAEGLAMYKNCLYQISWREQILFIYDKTSLNEIKKINYPIAEGWGLAFNDTNFIMTDGSNNLYFMEPKFFTQVSKIEVCDNKGPVKYLNELEYVKGLLYANIYTTNNIVIINTTTGEVIGIIDFSGLLNKIDYTSDTDVLNGIAYNPSTGHFYVTGKYWPKLFEIDIERIK